tara:strand:- start:42 stop:407 length:366 start_codon:yes stop_codon:yes gene_type:complete
MSVMNESEAVFISTKMINKMKNIHKDDKGYYFYGGTKNNDIECPENLEVLQDNETRLRKIFKNHHNWSNMRNSQKPVGNHLRFIFSKLTNKKVYPSITVRFGDYTCRKYYLPDCIAFIQGI